jgi:hypothetical protein
MEYDKSKKLARHGWIDLGNRFDLYRGDRELHMKAYPAKGTEKAWARQLGSHMRECGVS